MKRPILWCIIVLVGLVMIGSGIAASAQSADLPVLVRLDLASLSEAHDLPVYAHLQDAVGSSYALVIASPLQVRQSGLSCRVLDAGAKAGDYVIAVGRRPGARGQASLHVNVLHDDGLHIIARATPEQAEALAGLGFELQRLDAPLIVRAPAASLVAAFSPDPLVAGMVAQVQQSTVYTYDGRLSGEWPAIVGGAPYTITSRYTNSGTPIQKATQYVYEHMQTLGLGVGYHDWAAGGYSNRNVIGIFTGTTQPGEIVLVTAHLDDAPSSGRAPGADDNASGSVGVLVAADILSQYQFERTIRFVFFTGEEQGLYGSQQYANLVYAAGDNIVAVYNMDMIAWDNTGGPTLRLHTRTTGNPGYPGDLAIAGVFTNVVNAYGLGGSLTPIIDPDGITASDHSPFWSKGYSAILAIEDDVDDFNDYYHTSNDKLSTLNLTYFTNYVKASVGTAAHLARPVSKPGMLTGLVFDAATFAPIAGAQVEATRAAQVLRTNSDSDGIYSLSIPSGIWTVTASMYGYLPTTIDNVAVVSGFTTVQDISLTLASVRVVSGTIADAVTGWPLYASISIAGYPTGTIWNDPATGFYSVTLAEGITYTFDVTAWRGSYNAASRSVGPLTADRTESFSLTIDPIECNAPGYNEGPCTPQAGGLVVGNVYDANIGVPLAGARVMNESGLTVTATATADPAVADSFYVLFSPAGSRTFTATMIGGYGAVVTTTNVVQSGTVRLDLHLPAGRLFYLPPSMAISLTLGMSATVPFTLTNNGALAVNWELSELPNAPWLTETPATGIVAPMASQVISATFDANLPQVTHPGDQSAGLRINHDTPYVLADVPVTLTVVAPDLVISQSGPVVARAGETITYTIYYTNGGTVTANNVTIRDTLPASTTSAVEPVWSLVSLTAGMSGTVEFTATLESGLTFDTLLANHVTITSTDDEFDTLDNNAWFTTTVVARPTAGFVSSSPGTLGQATWFTNTTFGTLPIAYTWDFGDGTPPLVGVKDPSHVYTNAGIYTAWLTATNAYGQDTITSTVTIILYRSYLPLVIKDQG